MNSALFYKRKNRAFATVAVATGRAPAAENSAAGQDSDPTRLRVRYRYTTPPENGARPLSREEGAFYPRHKTSISHDSSTTKGTCRALPLPLPLPLQSHHPPPLISLQSPESASDTIPRPPSSSLHTHKRLEPSSGKAKRQSIRGLLGSPTYVCARTSTSNGRLCNVLLDLGLDGSIRRPDPLEHCSVNLDLAVVDRASDRARNRRREERGGNIGGAAHPKG